MNMLLAVPGVAPTVNARYYVLGYYSNTNVNPTGIIPRGTPVNFTLPESRTAA
jgi:glutathionyl-hydroquinone reductase